MSLDLDFDDAQQAVASALEQFCADQCTDDVVKALAGKFPEALWKGIAELGVLSLATPEGDGGAGELVAAMEALGRAVFPGPLAATFFATQVLSDSDRVAVATGQAVVSLGQPPLMPWAPHAHVFVEVEGVRAWKASASGEVQPVDTIGGEPWGRVELTREEELSGVSRARALYDIALAAYLAAAGAGLVEATAEHARTRKQFGRAIGEFQAVAHPLADCSIDLTASATLARSAAFHWNLDDEEAASKAAAARLSARRSALEAAHTCHQLFGAIGITLEGEVFHVSRRIRQLASQPPDDAPERASLLAEFGL